MRALVIASSSLSTLLAGKSWGLAGEACAQMRKLNTSTPHKARSLINLDTIMLHKAGMTNAVATLGTALTKEHIPLLNKGDPEIILSYDGDKAGINAAFRASSLLAPLSKKGGVVIFPDGADPADMVASGRLEELKALFAKPAPFIELLVSIISSTPLPRKMHSKRSAHFLARSPRLCKKNTHLSSRIYCKSRSICLSAPNPLHAQLAHTIHYHS